MLQWVILLTLNFNQHQDKAYTNIILQFPKSYFGKLWQLKMDEIKHLYEVL